MSEKSEANLQRKDLSRDLATQYLCRSSLVRVHRSPTAMSQHVCRNIWVKRNQHVGGKTCTDCSGVALLAVLGPRLLSLDRSYVPCLWS